MRHPSIIILALLSLSFNLLRTPMHWRDLYKFTAYAKNLSHVLLFYRPNNKKFQRVNVRAIRVCCKRIHAIISPYSVTSSHAKEKSRKAWMRMRYGFLFWENWFEIHFIRRNSLNTEAWKLAREWPPDTFLPLLPVIKGSYSFERQSYTYRRELFLDLGLRLLALFENRFGYSQYSHKHLYWSHCVMVSTHRLLPFKEISS